MTDFHQFQDLEKLFPSLGQYFNFDTYCTNKEIQANTVWLNISKMLCKTSHHTNISQLNLLSKFIIRNGQILMNVIPITYSRDQFEFNMHKESMRNIFRYLIDLIVKVGYNYKLLVSAAAVVLDLMIHMGVGIKTCKMESIFNGNCQLFFEVSVRCETLANMDYKNVRYWSALIIRMANCCTDKAKEEAFLRHLILCKICLMKTKKVDLRSSLIGCLNIPKGLRIWAKSKGISGVPKHPKIDSLLITVDCKDVVTILCNLKDGNKNRKSTKLLEKKKILKAKGIILNKSVSNGGESKQKSQLISVNISKVCIDKEISPNIASKKRKRNVEKGNKLMNGISTNKKTLKALERSNSTVLNDESGGENVNIKSPIHKRNPSNLLKSIKEKISLNNNNIFDECMETSTSQNGSKIKKNNFSPTIKESLKHSNTLVTVQNSQKLRSSLDKTIVDSALYSVHEENMRNTKNPNTRRSLKRKSIDTDDIIPLNMKSNSDLTVVSSPSGKNLLDITPKNTPLGKQASHVKTPKSAERELQSKVCTTKISPSLQKLVSEGSTKKVKSIFSPSNVQLENVNIFGGNVIIPLRKQNSNLIDVDIEVIDQNKSEDGTDLILSLDEIGEEYLSKTLSTIDESPSLEQYLFTQELTSDNDEQISNVIQTDVEIVKESSKRLFRERQCQNKDSNSFLHTSGSSTNLSNDTATLDISSQKMPKDTHKIVTSPCLSKDILELVDVTPNIPKDSPKQVHSGSLSENTTELVTSTSRTHKLSASPNIINNSPKEKEANMLTETELSPVMARVRKSLVEVNDQCESLTNCDQIDSTEEPIISIEDDSNDSIILFEENEICKSKDNNIINQGQIIHEPITSTEISPTKGYDDSSSEHSVICGEMDVTPKVETSSTNKSASSERISLSVMDITTSHAEGIENSSFTEKEITSDRSKEIEISPSLCRESSSPIQASNSSAQADLSQTSQVKKDLSDVTVTTPRRSLRRRSAGYAPPSVVTPKRKSHRISQMTTLKEEGDTEEIQLISNRDTRSRARD